MSYANFDGKFKYLLRKASPGAFGPYDLPGVLQGLFGSMVVQIPIIHLTAGVDVAATAVFVAPRGGCVIKKIGIVSQGTAAGILDADTCVIAVANATQSAAAIVSKTYNTAVQPPAANVYADLGTLANATLAGNDVMTLAVTQGATADLAASVLVVEYLPLNG